MRHVFANIWVYVGHESEVPAQNDFVSRTLGRRPIILTRGKNGALHVLINRCTHRGAVVCRQAQGNAARFVCGYHAWTFGNDGKCVGVPLSHAYGPAFDLSAQNLNRAPRVGKLSRIRLCLPERRGETRCSITSRMRARYLDEWIGPWRRPLPVVARAGSMRFETHANWKVIYDNAGDGYQPTLLPHLHAARIRQALRRRGPCNIIPAISTRRLC